MEEETESGCSCGWRVDLFVCSCFLDYLVESGAAFVVVVACKMMS